MKFFDWLFAHKSQIGGLITLILGFLLARGYLPKDIVTLILSILGLFGLANNVVEGIYINYRINHSGKIGRKVSKHR